jgi:MFS family permease
VSSGLIGIGDAGTQFSYLGEIFPTHLRAKGVCLGVAMISFMNIIWLQAAPTAFLKIGWKFYLCFIIPGTIGGICMLLLWPDTNGLPLEEIAAIFGDSDEVAIYQAEIEIDRNTHAVIVHKRDEKEPEHVESLKAGSEDAAEMV